MCVCSGGPTFIRTWYLTFVTLSRSSPQLLYTDLAVAKCDILVVPSSIFIKIFFICFSFFFENACKSASVMRRMSRYSRGERSLRLSKSYSVVLGEESHSSKFFTGFHHRIREIRLRCTSSPCCSLLHSDWSKAVDWFSMRAALTVILAARQITGLH